MCISRQNPDASGENPLPPHTIISSPVQTAVWLSRPLGDISGAGTRPGIRGWMVSSATICALGLVRTAPDDHFAARPNCRVVESGSGRIIGANGTPGIGSWIVSPAGAQRRLPEFQPEYPPHTIISLPVQTAV